jgi:hypothetical protein
MNDMKTFKITYFKIVDLDENLKCPKLKLKTVDIVAENKGNAERIFYADKYFIDNYCNIKKIELVKPESL